MEGREGGGGVGRGGGGMKGRRGVQMSENRVNIVHALYKLYPCTDVKERPIG